MIEVEKKYHVDFETFASLVEKMEEIESTEWVDSEEEENTLYSASFLNPTQVLRLRKASSYRMGMRKGVLTYKEPVSNENGLKQMIEIESFVGVNPLKEIFEKLGLVPSVIYEKIRNTWAWKGALICFDELPFGYFIEIEGKQETIEEIERILGLAEYVEPRSYPTLAKELYGTTTDVVEARFL